MSSQKSDLPTHPAAHEHVVHEKEQSKNGERVVNALDLDPFAAPSVYYGSSHSPRKVAKSRTLSAVSYNLPAAALAHTGAAVSQEMVFPG